MEFFEIALAPERHGGVGIDKFVNGEPVDGQDTVLWYAGHFKHDEAHPDPLGHVVGPELRPFNW